MTETLYCEVCKCVGQTTPAAFRITVMAHTGEESVYGLCVECNALSQAVAAKFANMRRCLRCSHRWPGRKSERPKVCPACKSPYWDRERRVTP